MKKIKIVEIGFSYKFGGIESFAVNYFSNFNKEKYEIYFINVFEKAKSASFYDTFKKIGIVFDLPNYRNHPFKFVSEFVKLNKEIKFDIFHYNMSSAVYLIPLYAAKKCKIKTIISHAHNNASDKGLIKKIIHIINKNLLSKYCNLYFACSESAANYFFSKKIINSNNYFQISNGIDLNKFNYNEKIRKSIRKSLNLNDNIILYGHVGSFKTIKNHKFLIDVFKEIHNLNNNSKLLLIGTGPLINEIKFKVLDYGLINDVIFLGEQKNVNEYLNAMDAFIFPSFNEGLGMVLIESQINGLTCFCSNTIPPEAQISRNFYRLFISDGKFKWANFICKTDINRNNYLCGIDKYDINYCVKNLEKIFDNQNKIKIAHFVYGIKNGGVEKVILNYYKNIDKNRFEFHIITQGECDNKNYNELINSGIIVHIVPKKSEGILKNYKAISIILKKEKFDIVHCHMSTNNFFPLFYSYVHGVKHRISHSHNALVKKSFVSKTLTFMSNIFDTNRVACSPEAAKWMFNTENNVYIMKNAMNINLFLFNKQIRNEIRKKLGYSDNDIVIGVVGRLEPQKNYPFLFRVFNNVFKELNNVKLLAIGSGAEENKLKQFVNKNHLNSSIKFLGSIDDVYKYYNAMDIFVLPSLYEGLGIVFIEAQINGLICLASNNVPKSTKISDNIFFAPLDEFIWYNELVKICKLLNGFERNMQIEKVNYNDYNIVTETKKLENYYEKIMKEK